MRPGLPASRHSAQTPYWRALAPTEVPRTAKAALTRTYNSLNIAQLQRDVLRCHRRLIELVAKKNRRNR